MDKIYKCQIHSNSRESTWPKKSNFMLVIKSAKWVIFKVAILIQYTLDLRKPDLRKNLDLRKIVATTDGHSQNLS